MPRLDPHSYADDAQAQTKHFDLTARVDFEARILDASVTLHFRAPAQGTLDLDTRDLTIAKVVDDKKRILPFVVHPAEPHLGARLSIALTEQTERVTIAYKTSPDASALQWLPGFLYTQCQAIHARSLIPLQDTPRLRVTYSLALEVPAPYVAVAAAADRGHSGTTFRFEMPQPIPPYLFAFAVGDLVSRDLSPRSRVWAQPAVVERAAWEFAGVEAFIDAAEALFGPYDWERFDILTMPMAFPYGGMENPRLTFLTPTLLAGDRSLVSVVAHELAHSWTGNLVTNANAEHFWLNEGFTMYAERRIVEATEGAGVASLHAALGRRELDESLARFAATPEMTKLRTHLEGVDPDDCYSLIPYEKGYFFLCALEAAVGRPAFEAWLKTYLAAFRFGAITTDDFKAHFEAAHPGVLARVNATAWLDQPGVPASAAAPRSDRLAAIEAMTGVIPPADAAWTATEWSLYLENQARPASTELLAALDARLTGSGNYDVLVAWLTLALQSGYRPVLPRAIAVLGEVGRMKYLRPLYTALLADAGTADLARAAFRDNRASYHPIARSMVEGLAGF